MRDRRTTQMGALSSPHGGRRSWRVGKGVVIAAPPLGHHSTMMPCFYGVLGFFPQTSPVVQSLIPVASGCLYTANSCPLPASALQTPLSSTQPPSATGDSRLRLGCAELQRRLCTQFLLCPAFHRPSTAFSFDPLKVSFCPS